MWLLSPMGLQAQGRTVRTLTLLCDPEAQPASLFREAAVEQRRPEFDTGGRPCGRKARVSSEKGMV